MPPLNSRQVTAASRIEAAPNRSGAEAALLAAQALADHGGGPLGHRGLRRLAARHRLLLGVVLDEVARRAAELEHRDLTLPAIAEAERHHRGADPGADVDRPF